MAKGVKTGGRKAGTPNKLTGDLRAAIREAFEKAGGVGYLHKVAIENPAVFCALLGRVLPMEVQGTDGGPIQIVVNTGVPRE